jgi:hypothetical protein
MSYFGKAYSGFSIAAVILFFSEETRDMQLLLRHSICFFNSPKFHHNIHCLFYLADSLFINAETKNAFFSDIVLIIMVWLKSDIFSYDIMLCSEILICVVVSLP